PGCSGDSANRARARGNTEGWRSPRWPGSAGSAAQPDERDRGGTESRPLDSGDPGSGNPSANLLGGGMSCLWNQVRRWAKVKGANLPISAHEPILHELPGQPEQNRILGGQGQIARLRGGEELFQKVAVRLRGKQGVVQRAAPSVEGGFDLPRPR